MAVLAEDMVFDKKEQLAKIEDICLVALLVLDDDIEGIRLLERR
jgi:hypothetical protein